MTTYLALLDPVVAIVARWRRGPLLALKRSAVVVLDGHRPPVLGLHPLEDPAGVARRNPAVAAAFRTTAAEGDVLAAVGADDHQRVRQLEFLFCLGVETVQKSGQVGEGVVEGHY